MSEVTRPIEQPRLTAPMLTPSKSSLAAARRKILAEVTDQLPAVWTAYFLIERIVSDPKDRREVETAERALDELRRSGKVTVDGDELVRPTWRHYQDASRIE
jgi:hypothetical protein